MDDVKVYADSLPQGNISTGVTVERPRFDTLDEPVSVTLVHLSMITFITICLYNYYNAIADN
jgi:hypothetical protein